MSAEPYKACRATVASWPTWENRPCAIKRGLQWDAAKWPSPYNAALVDSLGYARRVLTGASIARGTF